MDEGPAEILHLEWRADVHAQTSKMCTKEPLHNYDTFTNSDKISENSAQQTQ